MDAFASSLSRLLKHEGGYVDHPRDPGGETNLGVTRRVWQEWTGKSDVDMKALTPAKVSPLYKARYWDAVRGDDLPPALAHCVFDFAVNTGPARASRYLQKLVGASTDGKVGPATLAAIRSFIYAHENHKPGSGVAAAVRGYQNLRRTFYRQLETFDVFGRGWLRRVDLVESEALRMLP